MAFDLAKLQRDWIGGISGADFIDRVYRCCNQLKALSPDDQARGALIAEADPAEFAAAFFAAVSLDIPAILANPDWGDQEWAQLATLVQPAISFHRGVTGNARRSPDSVSAGVINGAPALELASILIPTGGTTGGVKLAIHTWASLEASCRGVQDFLGGGAIDSCCVLPLYHVSGLMQLLRAYHTRGGIRFDEDEVEGRCLSYVPTQLQRAMAEPERIRKMETARVIFIGGAGMPETVAVRARELRLPVVPVYGMTETAAMVAAVPNEDFLNDPQAGAVALGEARFTVEDGQIRVKTPALFQGYQGREPLDLSRGYLTGDQGQLDEAGRLHVLGRMDRLINSGGEKVDPREVESALIEIKGIESARVFGEPDPEWGQAVVAEVECSRNLDFAVVRAQLKTQLSAYKVPKRFRRLNADQNVGATLVPPAAAQSPTGGINDAPTVAPTEKILPVRKTHHLYRGRCSIPNVRYFITVCSKERRPALTDPAVADSILAAWRRHHTDHDFIFHCGTVMPDHIHFLFTLCDRLPLGKVMIKLKAKTKAALAAAGLEWQRDFHEHRLRADDAMEGFARYIFLNPYRRNLLSPGQTWPHWHLSRDYRPQFVEHLNANGAPAADWLADSPGVRDLIESDCQSKPS